MKLFFQILVGTGFLMLAGAVLTYIQSVNFINHAQLTTGTIVALSMSTDPDDSSNYYCPQVRYTTQSGQTVNFDANTCSTAQTYKVGDQVEVYYDPQNPQVAQLKRFAAQYLASTSLVVVGLPIAVVGMLALFLQKKRARASQA
jgi:hypothetical protein